MPPIEESWIKQARMLGFPSEAAMLRDFYARQGRSIREVASLLGQTPSNVRRRLLVLGVRLRERGGPNHLAPIGGKPSRGGEAA
jgi:hypothetical protein